MNAKSLGILIGILLVVVVGVVATQMINRSAIGEAPKVAGEKVIDGLKPVDVTGVKIEGDEGSVTLIQAENPEDGWTVKERDGYEAKGANVRDLVIKLWELAIVDGIKAGASTHGRFQLSSPDRKAPMKRSGQSGDTSWQGEKELGSIVIGKDFDGAPQEGASSPFPGFTMNEKGSYVWTPTSPDMVWRVKAEFYDVRVKPSDWLETDLVSDNSIKAVEVTHPEASDSWKVYRDGKGSDLNLAGPRRGARNSTRARRQLQATCGHRRPFGTFCPKPRRTRPVSMPA